MFASATRVPIIMAGSPLAGREGTRTARALLACRRGARSSSSVWRNGPLRDWGRQSDAAWC
jgi:hypothetical protein